MKLAILPRYKDLKQEANDFSRLHYVVNNHDIMARENGVGLCAILSPFEFEDICQVCDGLIIPGSSNPVNPSYYGQDPIDIVYDEFALDVKVIDYFVKNNKPILGICAGIQALNIYFGGDIGRIPAEKNHVYRSNHSIIIEKDSFVYDAYKSETATVNSYHVMHLEKLGEGLRVVARSEEGIIEAVENKEKRIFGTQWHPERSYHNDDPFGKVIFENFLKHCRN